MQGKEASEQETRKCTAGIDVSKHWLDAHVLPAAQSLHVANTREGIRQLKRWLFKYRVDLVAVEATGKWHRELCRSLRASHIAVAVIDPYRVRNYAKAERVLAKTDQLDAKVLAMFAAAMNPSCRPPAPQLIEDMQELVTARANAVEEETSLQNQLGSAKTGFLKRQLARRVAQLKAHIKDIERVCLEQIKSDHVLARRFTILTSIPGFGKVVAITLIAFLNELGSLTNKQIGALAGVVPHCRRFRREERLPGCLGRKGHHSAHALPRRTLRLEAQQGHEALSSASLRRRQSAKGLPHRHRQKTRRSRQHAHHRK